MAPFGRTMAYDAREKPASNGCRVTLDLPLSRDALRGQTAFQRCFKTGLDFDIPRLLGCQRGFQTDVMRRIGEMLVRQAGDKPLHPHPYIGGHAFLSHSAASAWPNVRFKAEI